MPTFTTASRPARSVRLEARCRRHETLELDAETHFIWFRRAAEQVWQRRLEFLTAARR